MTTQPLADIEADWPRLSGLLDEIMNLPPASRENFITALPPPDDRLADTLRELLALQAKVETEDFMDDLPVFPGVTASGEAAGWDALGAGAAGKPRGAGGLVEGAEVGPYRLLRPIGEGGMGAVWLAERADGTLKRKVALKLPRLAWAQDLAARMARERDILAGLEHPNIARLYDAGLDAQGRPWLALEFVEGRDLTTYCDAERLDLRARVRLFMQVLDAVQYAHASLVIHRDIKPANILVTPRGDARLLDFGIARLEEGAAEAGPDLTRTGVSAMTPRYASPEQVQGARLTVASDIYSLGVVLHELLTGETPYVLRRSSRAELEQAILDADLRVPSRLKATAEAAAARATTPERIARDLRGDLDAVLLRALARMPAARYASAAAFRDDLERWLEGRPVSALPPSRLHTLRKFVARNRLAVGASAAAALALVAVSVVAVVQAQRATREATTATRAKDFLVQIYGEADPLKSDTKDPNARALLERAERDLENRFAGEPALQAEVLNTLQQAWVNLGDLRRGRSANERRAALLLSLGEDEKASLAMLYAAENALSMRDYAAVHAKLPELRRVVGDLEAAPADLQGRYHYLRGALHGEQGRVAEAAAAFERSIAITREQARQDPSADVWLFTRLMGKIWAVRLRDGAAAARRDIAEAESIAVRFSPAQAKFVRPAYQLAVAHYRNGDYSAGWRWISRSIAVSERDFGSDNPMVLRDRRYWLRFCVSMGETTEAARWLQTLWSSGDAALIEALRRDVRFRLQVAEVYAADGDWQSFDRETRDVRAIVEETLKTRQPGFPDDEVRLLLLEARGALARGRIGDAKALLDEGMADRPGDGIAPEDRYRRDWLRGNVARMVGDVPDAQRLLAGAGSSAAELLGEDHPDVALIGFDLALALAAPGTEVSDERITSLLRRATMSLRAHYADNAGIIARVDRVGQAMVEGSRPPYEAVRRRLAGFTRDPPVLFH